MQQFWKKHRTVLTVSAVGTIILLCFIYWQFSSQQQGKSEQEAGSLFSDMSRQDMGTSSEPKTDAIEKKTEEAIQEVVVDIKGAVRKPGIYRMQPDDRVSDVINRAGGLTEQADQNTVNLAQKVSDEMVIYIARNGEKDVPLITSGTDSGSGLETGVSSNASGQSEKVNINTADEQQMQNLPGIGPAKAKAIIVYRQEHGLFGSVDDLMNVTGIGEKSMEKIRPAATVD